MYDYTRLLVLILVSCCSYSSLFKLVENLPVLQEIHFSAILLLYVVVRMSMHQSLMVKSLTFCGFM